MINKRVFWTCSKHDLNASDCEIKPISQEMVYSLFIKLHNNLQHNYKQILVLLQTAVQDLKSRRYNGNFTVIEIHKEIAKHREHTHVHLIDMRGSPVSTGKKKCFLR